MHNQQDLKISVLSERGWTGAAKVSNAQPNFVSVQVEVPIPFGHAVRIDADDALILGEVSNCVENAPGYTVEIRLQQIIPSLTNLSKLVSAVMCAGVRPTSPATNGEPSRRASEV